MHRGVLLILLTVLAMPLLPLWVAGPGPNAPPAHAAQVADEHPEVETWESCEDCHAEETPDEFQEWFAGKHGLNNVKCLVCHGSVGADFVIHPSQDRCLGCHGEKLASMQTSFMGGKNCFSCHPAHRLNPHLTIEEGIRP
jgi:hypothetical protein